MLTLYLQGKTRTCQVQYKNQSDPRLIVGHPFIVTVKNKSDSTVEIDVRLSCLKIPKHSSSKQQLGTQQYGHVFTSTFVDADGRKTGSRLVQLLPYHEISIHHRQRYSGEMLLAVCAKPTDADGKSPLVQSVKLRVYPRSTAKVSEYRTLQLLRGLS